MSSEPHLTHDHLVAALAQRKGAEQALHESEKLIYAILDNSPNLVFLKDARGRYLVVNKQFERAFGIERKQIEGKTDYEVFPPQQAAIYRANDLQVLHTGASMEFEETAFQDDGPHTSIVHKFPLFDAAGQVYAISGIATDITERERAERALRESEHRYRIVVETATDAVVSINQDSEIVFVNPATTRIFGYTAAELMGQSLTMLMPQSMQGHHEAAVHRYVSTRKRHVNWAGAELTGRRKNGQEFAIEVSFGEVTNHDQPIFTGFIRDISDRKQAEAIQAANARQVAARAAVSVAFTQPGCLRQGLQGCAQAMALHLDAALARIWTLNQDNHAVELQASAGSSSDLRDPQGRGGIDELRVRLIAEDAKPYLTNDLMRDPCVGDKIWVRTQKIVAFAGCPLLVEDRMVGVLCMFSRAALNPGALDILASIADPIAQGIERKRAEERLQATQSELRESAARLREMSARMQKDIEEERKRISQALHDEMGQNLTALQLDAAWIRRHSGRDPAIADTVDRMQRSIEDSAASMRRIVADMRPRVLDDVGINAAIKALLNDTATRTGVEVKFVSNDELDSIDDATKTALYRMLQECVTNVTRHAQATQVDVLLLSADRDIEMIVADNGRGFTPQARPKPGSFGLFGLSERAGQLGGTVIVESAPGKGTRVVVQLPLSRTAGSACAVQPVALQAVG